MSYQPDLDAYFRRIGHAGGREPTLATLNAIAFAHVTTIPFENLDVLLGRGVDLDPHAVERKLVHERRGGYCFEHNSLLLHVLTALGFAVTPLSARVRINRPRDFVPARTHMLLRVDIAGLPYVVDVGVGGFSLSCALRLDTETPQSTPHEPRRLVREGRWTDFDLRAPDARVLHQVLVDGAWQDVYELTLEPMPEIDREVANWFTSRHPRSHFQEHLMAARASRTGRVGLLDRRLTQRSLDGAVEGRELASPRELLDVLREEFGLDLPDDTRFPCPGLDFPL